MEEQCLFCAIAQKKMPAFIVYEDDYFIAFLDKFPATTGHTIVIPKKHAKTVYDMEDGEYLQMMGIVKILASVLVRANNASGVNMLCSVGEKAGQRVPHAFAHIIPRYDNDGVQIAWEHKQPTDEELSGLTANIKGVMFGPAPVEGKTEQVKDLPQQAEETTQKPQPTPEPQEKPKPRIPVYW